MIDICTYGERTVLMREDVIKDYFMDGNVSDQFVREQLTENGYAQSRINLLLEQWTEIKKKKGGSSGRITHGS